MSNQSLEIVKARKYFYRDYYRLACAALLGALMLITLLLLLLVYLYIERPSPACYATSRNGNLTSLTSLSTPNYSQTPLIQ